MESKAKGYRAKGNRFDRSSYCIYELCSDGCVIPHSYAFKTERDAKLTAKDEATRPFKCFTRNAIGFIICKRSDIELCRVYLKRKGSK